MLKLVLNQTKFLYGVELVVSVIRLHLGSYNLVRLTTNLRPIKNFDCVEYQKIFVIVFFNIANKCILGIFKT